MTKTTVTLYESGGILQRIEIKDVEGRLSRDPKFLSAMLRHAAEKVAARRDA